MVSRAALNHRLFLWDPSRGRENVACFWGGEEKDGLVDRGVTNTFAKGGTGGIPWSSNT